MKGMIAGNERLSMNESSITFVEKLRTITKGCFELWLTNIHIFLLEENDTQRILCHSILATCCFVRILASLNTRGGGDHFCPGDPPFPEGIYKVLKWNLIKFSTARVRSLQ
jgi:hypothetical protein